MNEALQWLLGLDRIRLGSDAPLSIRLATPPDAWIQFLGMVVAVLAVVWVYRREMVSRRRRIVLISLRMGVIGVLMLLLARPMLVLRRTNVEPSTVAILIDRSASMAVREQDAPEAAPANESGKSRWDSAIRVMLDPDDRLAENLLNRHELSIWTFDQDAQRVALWTEPGASAAASQVFGDPPSGSRTDLIAAVESVLDQTTGSRLSGMIVLSDGRQNIARPVTDATARATARSAPIHTVAIGSDRPRRDVLLASVRSDEHVFAYDRVAIRARIELTGYDQSIPLSIELRELATGRVLDAQQRDAGGEQHVADVEFMYRPEQGGRHMLEVRAVPRPDEVTHENNSAQLGIEVHDEKIRVLYVEGTPRFEYRYLRNMVVAEPTFESSCLLLDADEAFPQEGTRPIRRFPESIEELREYDVVILGDVDPGSGLSPSQATTIVNFVSNLGGGIAFIAGERFMPHRWQGTPLEELVPVRMDPGAGTANGSVTESYSIRLTPEGSASPMFRIETDAQANARTLASLPQWYWFARASAAKPGTMVLAEHPTATGEGGAVPLVVTGRHGAGRTLFIGSDDVWRWRRYIGEVYYENLWLQMIRTLARARRFGTASPWRLETDRRQYEPGQRVQVRLVADEGATLPDGATEVDIKDAAGLRQDRLELTELGPRLREGHFVATHPGAYSLSMAHRSIEGAGVAPRDRMITVVAHDSERNRIEADYDLLRSLSEGSGGRFFAPGDDLTPLAGLLTDKSIRTPDDVEEPLWDTHFMLLVFTGLIVTEWIVRKTGGLA